MEYKLTLQNKTKARLRRQSKHSAMMTPKQL